MENYFQPEIECASQEQIRQWQSERLVKQVKNVWDNVPMYRKRMEEKGLTPEDIKSVDDLCKLPFIEKDDLRNEYPYGLLARPLSDCVRIQSTSGTTGRRVVASIHSMILTFGKSAVQGRLWQQAEQRMMSVMSAMDMVFSPVVPG